MAGKREPWQVRAAGGAGRVLRRLGRGVPGVAGALLVCAGLGLAWLPLGLVAAGGFLLLLDWRIPAEDQLDEPRRLRAVA